MKEQAIQKINKIGKISNVIALIARIFFIVGMVLCLLGAILCFLRPAETMQVTMKSNMDLVMDYAEFGMSDEEFAAGMVDLDEENEGYEIQTQTVNIGSFDGSLSVSVAQQDYEPVDVKCENGKMTMNLETQERTLNFRHLGVFWIVAFVAMGLTAVTFFFIGALCKAFRDCTTPFEENVIKKMQNLAIALVPWTILSSIVKSTLESFMQGIVRINVSVDLGVVLVVLIVLVLVYIFKYGAVLQQESDETL